MTDLTWQEKMKRDTLFKIKNAFRNPETHKFELRTWKQLIEKIPKGTLSGYLNDLIKQGFIEVKVEINDKGKRQTVYCIPKDFVIQSKLKSKEIGAEYFILSEKGEVIEHGNGAIIQRYNSKIFRKEKKADS